MNNDILPQAIDNFKCHLVNSFDSIKLAYNVYERSGSGNLNS
jgi:hypothetical protein